MPPSRIRSTKPLNKKQLNKKFNIEKIKLIYKSSPKLVASRKKNNHSDLIEISLKIKKLHNLVDSLTNAKRIMKKRPFKLKPGVITKLKAEIMHVNTGIIVDTLMKILDDYKIKRLTNESPFSIATKDINTMVYAVHEYINYLYVPDKVPNYETAKKVNQFITKFAKEIIANRKNLWAMNRIAWKNHELVFKHIRIAKNAGIVKGHTDDVWMDRTIDAFETVEKVLPKGYPVFIPQSIFEEKLRRRRNDKN